MPRGNNKHDMVYIGSINEINNNHKASFRNEHYANSMRVCTSGNTKKSKIMVKNQRLIGPFKKKVYSCNEWSEEHKWFFCFIFKVYCLIYNTVQNTVCYISENNDILLNSCTISLIILSLAYVIKIFLLNFFLDFYI